MSYSFTPQAFARQSGPGTHLVQLSCEVELGTLTSRQTGDAGEPPCTAFAARLFRLGSYSSPRYNRRIRLMTAALRKIMVTSEHRHEPPEKWGRSAIDQVATVNSRHNIFSHRSGKGWFECVDTLEGKFCYYRLKRCSSKFRY